MMMMMPSKLMQNGEKLVIAIMKAFLLTKTLLAIIYSNSPERDFVVVHGFFHYSHLLVV